MSKKLIAVASAAALALTALVGVAPAMASSPSIVPTTTGHGGSGTSSAPYEIDVPARGIIQHDDSTVTPTGGVSTTTNTAMEIVIGTSPALAAGDVITITTTGPVRALLSEVTAASNNVDGTTLGKSSLTITKEDTAVEEVYIYTTSSTVAGTVEIKVTRSGSSTSSLIHVKGVAGPKHTVNVVTPAPASMANGTTATVKFTVSDVFGNVVAAQAAAISVNNTRSTTVAAPTWSTSDLVYETVVTSSSNSAFVASLDIGAETVIGMKAPSDSFVAVVNSPGASAQITALTAQVATLTAQVAKRVSKKKYNTLARKWNAAFPSQKVALKK